MQGLEQIHAQNANAAAQSLHASRDPNKWGLSRYDGLHFYDYVEFDNQQERDAAAVAWEAKSGALFEDSRHDPVTNTVKPGRLLRGSHSQKLDPKAAQESTTVN